VVVVVVVVVGLGKDERNKENKCMWGKLLLFLGIRNNTAANAKIKTDTQTHRHTHTHTHTEREREEQNTYQPLILRLQRRQLLCEQGLLVLERLRVSRPVHQIA
jgi:hypothetical protein